MVKFELMRIEQNQSSGERAFERISGPARYWAENILAGTSVEYHPDFGDKYIRAIQEGYLPVPVATHQSHFDGVTLSLVTQDLTLAANSVLDKDHKLKGFMLPLANSLATGNQGTGMRLMYASMRPIIERKNLTPVLLTRRKDVYKYNMKSNLREYMEALAQGMTDGYSIAIFPEGSVEAGRKAPDGAIKGMQPFSEGAIRSVLITAKIANKKVIFIPVGISGGYEVHNPNTKLPTKKALTAGFGLGNMNLVSIKVGLPIKQEDLEQVIQGSNNKEKLTNEFFAKKLEELLKPNGRRRK